VQQGLPEKRAIYFYLFMKEEKERILVWRGGKFLKKTTKLIMHRVFLSGKRGGMPVVPE